MVLTIAMVPERSVLVTDMFVLIPPLPSYPPLPPILVYLLGL